MINLRSTGINLRSTGNERRSTGTKRRSTAAAGAAALALVISASCTGGIAQAEPTATTAAAAAPVQRATPLAPTGDITPIHDPALIKDGGVWYVFSTGYIKREQGGTIRIATSRDRGRTWKSAGSVWDEIPAWIDRHYADAGKTLPENLWAPEIVKHGGTYYLYYSASTFGGNDSITALATNTTLDATDPDYRWVDRGTVVTSPAANLSGTANLEFNAIDAGVISDRAGKPWMAIGSFWNGIFVVPLSWPSGKPVKGWRAKAVQLAERPGVQFDPIEAPYPVRHGKYYYLFTSWDFCCRGADATYKIAVGRSTQVTGPFRDKTGALLLDGGGTVLLQGQGKRAGAGGQSVSKNTLAYHYYDGANRAAPYIPTLGLKRIRWTNGWPTLSK